MANKHFDTDNVIGELARKGIKLKTTAVGDMTLKFVSVPKDDHVGIRTWGKIDFVCKALGIEWKKEGK